MQRGRITTVEVAEAAHACVARYLKAGLLAAEAYVITLVDVFGLFLDRQWSLRLIVVVRLGILRNWGRLLGFGSPLSHCETIFCEGVTWR